MPFVVIAVLFGFGGVLYGADQHDQRIKEQRMFRATLEQLRAKLFLNEIELAGLRALLGEKNSQVAQLVARVEYLHAYIAEFQKWAA